jgi:hypothetical protein
MLSRAATGCRSHGVGKTKTARWSAIEERPLIRIAKCRFWPKADIRCNAMNVRFRGQSGHCRPGQPIGLLRPSRGGLTPASSRCRAHRCGERGANGCCARDSVCVAVAGFCRGLNQKIFKIIKLNQYDLAEGVPPTIPILSVISTSCKNIKVLAIKPAHKLFADCRGQ